MNRHPQALLEQCLSNAWSIDFDWSYDSSMRDALGGLKCLRENSYQKLSPQGRSRGAQHRPGELGS
jgi:hypothetical protein